MPTAREHLAREFWFLVRFYCLPASRGPGSGDIYEGGGRGLEPAGAQGFKGAMVALSSELCRFLRDQTPGTRHSSQRAETRQGSETRDQRPETRDQTERLGLAGVQSLWSLGSVWSRYLGSDTTQGPGTRDQRPPETRDQTEPRDQRPYKAQRPEARQSSETRGQTGTRDHQGPPGPRDQAEVRDQSPPETRQNPETRGQTEPRDQRPDRDQPLGSAGLCWSLLVSGPWSLGSV